MAPEVMAELLKLSPSERVDLALALWESLDDPDREAALALTPDQAAEFDRRLAEHRANPTSAIPWKRSERSSSATNDPLGRFPASGHAGIA